MLTFIKFTFWLGVIACVIRLGRIAICNYPREEETSLGADLVGFILKAAATAWAAVLIYR